MAENPDEDEFITSWRRDAKLLDEVAEHHDRMACVWSERTYPAIAAACRHGAQSLRSDADAAEEDVHDARKLAEEDEPFGEEP